MDSQKQALSKALTSKVSIIIGGPGIGKATLLKSILQILNERHINLSLYATHWTSRHLKSVIAPSSFLLYLRGANFLQQSLISYSY